jgi:hypothetical protein
MTIIVKAWQDKAKTAGRSPYLALLPKVEDPYCHRKLKHVQTGVRGAVHRKDVTNELRGERGQKGEVGQGSKGIKKEWRIKRSMVVGESRNNLKKWARKLIVIGHTRNTWYQ